MKYSYNLLAELVDLRNLRPKALAEKIKTYSFEVEGVEELNQYGVPDFFLSIETGKTNRVDTFGHLGLAREISAITRRSQKKDYQINLPEDNSRSPLRLQVNSKLCKKYAAWRLRNVKVKSSPNWLKSRLAACGLKPINNLVDIANYVMLLTGQPLHVFDAKKIRGGIIQVRSARSGERLLTLDGEQIQLKNTDIVIADKERAIALAGIKGGMETGVTSQTTEIILEAANFNPRLIRRTSWRLGLRTDAANRFEKNLPPEFVESGLNEASGLLEKLAGAKPGGLVLKDYTQKQKKLIALDKDYVSELLGYQVNSSLIESILRRLGFVIQRKTKTYRVVVPFYRRDVNLPEDLIEEVGRINGYDRIREQKPVSRGVSSCPISWSLREEVLGILQGLGFSEVYNYSFYSKETAKRHNLPENLHLKLLNPLSLDQELLRISLLPNLKVTLENNLRYFPEVALMEFGNVYTPKKTENFHDLPRLALCYALKAKPKEVFLKLKGKLEALFAHFHLPLNFVPSQRWLDNKNHPAYLTQDNKFLTVLDSQAVEDLGVAVAELDLLTFLKAIPAQRKFNPFSKYPKSSRDIAVIVDKKLTWANLEKFLHQDKNVQSLRLFDVYEGSQIPSGKKSLAFQIVFQDPTRTLSQEEINLKLERIIKSLKTRFKVEVR